MDILAPVIRGTHPRTFSAGAVSAVRAICKGNWELVRGSTRWEQMVSMRAAIFSLAVALGCGMLVPAALAYTATGDRQFPAAVLLPQITPGDEFYLTYNT